MALTFKNYRLQSDFTAFCRKTGWKDLGVGNFFFILADKLIYEKFKFLLYSYILPPSLHVKDNQQKADHWGEGKNEKIIWRLVW